MHARWTLTFSLALGLGLVAPGPAAGQDALSGDARLDARAQADKGLALFEAGKYKEALESFQEANWIFPRATTIQRMIARSHDRLGRLLEARHVYETIVSSPLAEGAPPVFIEARRLAAAELKALTARVPTVRISLAGAPSGETLVFLDGWQVDIGRPIARDPGTYTASVRAPGRAPVTRSFTLKEGAREELTILLPTPPAAPAPRALGPDEAARGPDMVVIGGGTAAAALLAGLGVTFAAFGVSRRAEADELCPDGACPDGSTLRAAQDLSSRGDGYLTGSTICLVGAGLAGVATLVYGIASPRPRSASVRPRVHDQRAATSLAWTW